MVLLLRGAGIVTYKNHLKLGFTTVNHRNKKVVTVLNSKSFLEGMGNIESLTYKTGVIPPGFEHRADRIAYLFYDNPNLDWLVCWSNNVSDPFQQLNVGDRIRILDL